MSFQIQPSLPKIPGLGAALFVTLITAVLAWYLAGAPGTNGIDDAAITRSYSENLANGHGFVYNIGDERVEGATSFLWTVLVAVPYLFWGNPEFAILSITTLFTVLAVFFGLRVAHRAAGELPGLTVVGIMVVALIGLPGFFIWSVWSMMEIALWSALCMLLLDRLSLLTEPSETLPAFDPVLLLAALAMPLTRPEGIAVAVGLVLLACVLRPAVWRPLGLAVLAALASFAALVLGRIAYFGFPFPNTYYAKVSSDRLQNIVDGAKYLASFVTEQPFAEVLVGAWVLLAALSGVRLLRAPRPGDRTRLLASALVLGILSVYVMLGGDHFALWRFYQPIMPILALPVVLFGVWALRTLPRRGQIAGISLALFFWAVLNSLAFYQERFGIAKEYQLSMRGEVFGRYLNDISPSPVLGVVAAGGIALTYDGKLRDLMGLNWVEMAHANPVKVGFRNHASFDVDTFWKHPPDLLALFHKTRCQRTGWTEKSSAQDTGIKQLYGLPRFQNAYTPIIMDMGNDRCTNGFAANSWLSQVNTPGITAVAWDDLVIVGRPGDS
jgi:hypothetical protein